MSLGDREEYSRIHWAEVGPVLLVLREQAANEPQYFPLLTSVERYALWNPTGH